MRNDFSINFHLSKLSIAKFSILYDISLVRDWKRKLKLITLASEGVKPLTYCSLPTSTINPIWGTLRNPQHFLKRLGESPWCCIPAAVYVIIIIIIITNITDIIIIIIIADHPSSSSHCIKSGRALEQKRMKKMTMQKMLRWEHADITCVQFQCLW